MASWMEWFPERFEDELDAYRRNSIEIKIDESSKARGILGLDAVFSENGKPYRIRIVYPNLFPYFQPMAFLLEERLERHQSPFGGHLCLLGRGTDQWDSSDNFGDILAERFPIILEINREEDVQKKALLEEPQGEPFTEYFNGMGIAGSAIIYQDSWDLPKDIPMGLATLRCARPTGGKKSAEPLTGVIKSIRNKAEVLAEWDGPSFDQFSTDIRIPWVRLDSPPIDGVLQSLSDEQKSHIGWDRHKRNHAVTFLLIFPEEAEQFTYRDGIACVTLHPRISKVKNKKMTLPQLHFQRTFRAGPSELQARMPGIAELHKKRVTVFGLGALGSFAVVELARAGIGNLRLVDFDYVEPATVRRWVIGASAFGKQKAQILAEHIQKEYPWSKTEAVGEFKIGDLQAEGTTGNQFDQIVEMLADADLVLDLTAEFGVNEFLSMLSAKMEVPYLRGSATPGAWGGYLAFFAQQKNEACWACMTHDLYGEEWSGDIPPADPEGTVQPPGCPSLTFTGTSVDLQEISLEVVRQAMGLLTDEYPLPKEQLSILRHRDTDGSRVPPQWINRSINRREGCGCA